MGLVVSILALVYASVWTPDSTGFLDPKPMSDAEPEPADGEVFDDFLPLAEVRPDEETPAAEVVSVEEFGFGISMDGTSLTWGASVRNTHSEYAADFALQVYADGVTLYDARGLEPDYSRMTLPGGQVLVGDSIYVGDDFPADSVVEVKVVLLGWFALDGETPPELQEPPLSTRVDAVDTGDESQREKRYSVTITNSADHAVDPHLSAIFRNSDGALVGGTDVHQDSSLPPGDSTRELRVWTEDIPAGADLSLTEFVPTW
ncbi:hypothetical protein O1R50_22645 [Glycomyces luteolus]|uniref:Uncharacterized protein n=1 Tax=Glycomyces luteolus TaxID=2670330 RepID=A0A9X3SSD8_9ACTN|nr:hypothetical protein [Glycomyces luteolus]MDA1362441.1 hypothetical protein [Glycomyces luteolus]